MQREMKDSGIEWIGEIPKDWEVQRLKSLFIERKEKNDPIKTDFILSLGISYGVVPYSEKEGGGNKAKEDLTGYRLAYPNDIVMNSMNIISGSVGISSYFGCVSPVYYILYPHINSNAQYYCYLFQTKAFQRSLLGLGNGILMRESSNGVFNTIRMRIPMEKLGIQLLPVPLIEQQKRIVDFLDVQCTEIDSVLERTRTSIEEYKKLKQAVITQAVTKGVRGNRPMKDSGIEWSPNIPVNVNVSRVGLHFNIILGKMLCPKPLDNTYTLEKYFCAADVHFEGISIGEQKEMWFNTLEKKQYLVKQGDLLVVEGGAGAGGCAIVSTLSQNIYIQNSIMIVRPKEKNDCRYLKYLLESLVRQGYIDVVCNKATIPHFTKDKLMNAPFFTFSLQEQVEIADYLDTKCTEIDNLIEKKQQYLMELENYKKSLIYEYVTGKKEVPQ